MNKEKISKSTAVPTAEKDKTGYGKFKDAESLYQAYNFLQAEFTKRCQRVKELEEKLQDSKKAETLKGVSVEDNAVGNEDVVASKQSGPATGKDAFLIEQGASIDKNNANNLVDDVVEVATKNDKTFDKIQKDIVFNDSLTDNSTEQDLNKITEKQKEEIIKEYLLNLKKNGFTAIISSGDSIKTPVNRPKTVAEAGEMAKKYFTKIKEIN